MKKYYLGNTISKIIDLKFSNKIILSYFMFILLISCTISANDTNVSKLDINIKDIIEGTEEDYVLTDKGCFALPNPGNEVKMESVDLSLLYENLKKVKDHKSTIILYKDIIVGILSDNQNINFKPEFKIKQKIIYTQPPIEIMTTMKRWATDTYRLSVETSDGTFCIYDSFDVSDYYNKVYQKLMNHYKKDEVLNAIIKLKYHKIEDGYECQGDIEDIIFEK